MQTDGRRAGGGYFAETQATTELLHRTGVVKCRRTIQRSQAGYGRRGGLPDLDGGLQPMNRLSQRRGSGDSGGAGQFGGGGGFGGGARAASVCLRPLVQHGRQARIVRQRRRG